MMRAEDLIPTSGKPANDELILVLQRIAEALERIATQHAQPQEGAHSLAVLPAVQSVPPASRATGCPVHGVPWRTVPAGVSRRTGRAYAAFMVCSVPDCQERPQ